MVLSRFWSSILVASVLYVFGMLAWGRLYTLQHLVNGKQNDPVLSQEVPVRDFAAREPARFSAIEASKGAGVQAGDTLYQLTDGGVVQISVGRQRADGLFPTCRNTVVDLWLPLVGYLTFFCGLLHLLEDSNALQKLARLLTPMFERLFPGLPSGHAAYGYMTMNFAANFLGLDNAATPFGLKAMESMQAVNVEKSRASDSQIMFLCLHAAGLTLIPTSIIGYRAAQHAANPADVMLPTIITSFIGTLAALIFVGVRQRIQLLNRFVVGLTAVLSLGMGGLLYYLTRLGGTEKVRFTGNLSNVVLLGAILLVVGYALVNERVFREKGTNLFESFVAGAKDGFTTGVRVLPYMIAMLAALSIFRNSGLMDMVLGKVSALLAVLGVDRRVADAIPVALMRPFSAGGARGFMLDAMRTYGPDSLTGQLSCLFQGAAETTFYVVALYFGSVGVKDSRYTLGIMLLVDLVCVLTAIAVCRLYF